MVMLIQTDSRLDPGTHRSVSLVSNYQKLQKESKITGNTICGKSYLAFVGLPHRPTGIL